MCKGRCAKADTHTIPLAAGNRNHLRSNRLRRTAKKRLGRHRGSPNGGNEVGHDHREEWIQDGMEDPVEEQRGGEESVAPKEHAIEIEGQMADPAKFGKPRWPWVGCHGLSIGCFRGHAHDTMVLKEFTMPLRDHFCPPVSKNASWEGFHGMWPASIVRQLRKQLPPGYVAEPRVHLGTLMEIDVGALQAHAAQRVEVSDWGDTAMTAWTASAPAVAVETDPPDEYEYEVRVFDVQRERSLVAAIELVSPANKDRPESRQAFVAKCAALLRKGVALSVVDLVTIRRFNLYAQLMEFIGHPDQTMSCEEPPIYAASCRWVTKGMRARLEAWSHSLAVGQPLPALPLWLRENLVTTLDLEQSYEQACNDLWIS